MSGYATAVLAKSPVAYWRLGEASGTSAADDTGDGHTGTYVGAPALGQPGAILGDADGAVGFNGSSQYVSVPFSSALNPSSFSLEVWAYVTGGAGDFRAAISNRDDTGGVAKGAIIYAQGAGIGGATSDTWAAWLGSGSNSGADTFGWYICGNNTPVTLNKWTHLVLTYDGTTMLLYIDGVLDSSRTASCVVNTTQPFFIGAGQNENPASFFFQGRLDEPAVYSGAMSAAQVVNNYAASGRVAVIQHGSPSEGSGGSNDFTFTNATETGNSIIVACQLYGESGGSDVPDMATVGPVTDNATGTTWTRLTAGDVSSVGMSTPPPDYGQRIAWFIGTGFTGRSGHTVQANFNESAFSLLGLWEVSPCQFDQALTNRGVNDPATSLDVGTVTPSTDGALVLAGWTNDNRTNQFTADPGWLTNFNLNAGNGQTYNGSRAQATKAAVDIHVVAGGTPNVWWLGSGIVLIPPAPPTATDDFNRADGALGADWTDGTDGGLAIAGDAAVGSSGNLRNSLYTGATFGDDQYSELTVGGNPSLADFIGVGVRMQGDGADCVVAFYWYDQSDTNYRIKIYKRVSGSYADIGAEEAVSASGPSGYTLNGPLTAGDRVRISAVGDEFRVELNDRRIIKVTDGTLSSTGAPGIVSYGSTGTIDSWAGGDAAAETAAAIQTFTSSPPNSSRNSQVGGGGGSFPFPVKVIEPDAPAGGVPHRFLYVLQPDVGANYGDGLDTLYGLGAHNEYNCTLIFPTFGNAQDWMADHPTDATMEYESWMVDDLVPWVKANFATGGEEHWLIGFSRTGMGAMTLLLRNPTVFDKAAAWDWPFDMTTYTQYGADPNYGTQANFDTYAMSSGNLDAWKAPFQVLTRIWVGGYEAFQTDMGDVDAGLAAHGILHDYDPQIPRAHSWTSGWPANAMAALDAMPAAGSSMSRTAGDSFSISDSATRGGVGRSRSTADSFAIGSSSTRAVQGQGRQAADTVPISDTVHGLSGTGRFTSDAVNISDSVAEHGARARGAQDSVAIGDSSSRHAGSARGSTDSITFTDSAHTGGPGQVFSGTFAGIGSSSGVSGLSPARE